MPVLKKVKIMFGVWVITLPVLLFGVLKKDNNVPNEIRFLTTGLIVVFSYMFFHFFCFFRDPFFLGFLVIGTIFLLLVYIIKET